MRYLRIYGHSGRCGIAPRVGRPWQRPRLRRQAAHANVHWPQLAHITQQLERVAAGLLSLVSARAATACGLSFKELQHRVHVVSQGSITAVLEFGLRGALDI